MAKSKSTRLSDEKAAAVLRNYKKRPAMMSQETLFELDDAIHADTFGVTRRLALLMLTKPCAELIEGVSKDRDLAVATADAMKSARKYRDALDDLRAWIEEAQKRMAIALAMRTDMREILAEADARSSEVAHG